MSKSQLLEVPIAGMDCAECTRHVQTAIAKLPGVHSVEVLLASEKAIIQLDPGLVTLPAIRGAVQAAGYAVPEAQPGSQSAPARSLAQFSGRVLGLLSMLFAAIVLIVVVGEWLGVFEQISERVPFLVGIALVVLSGWPVFSKVLRAALNRQVISHTLMSLGVLAALAVGQWTTALVVVFFMRVGDYVEAFTGEGARRAVKDLSALSPQTARVESAGIEIEMPIAGVQPGDVVVVRPGEKIPVDGQVLSGQATLDQAVITGEGLPVEVGPGAQVFAASLARLGSLRIRAERIGPQSTFGRVVRLVEQAEANRAGVQRFADRFSAYFLPVVAGLAALTFLIRRDPLAAAAVLVVACSCSVALATPIAMLASIGRSAQRGVLIKGGKYLELLARADVILLDKTGTLTLGQPQVTDILPLNGAAAPEVLRLAATAERYSEHPLAEAVRAAAKAQGIPLGEPQNFESLPGLGVQARLDGAALRVGNSRLIASAIALPEVMALEQQGKSLLFVERDGELVGAVAAADTLRSEAPQALARMKELGIKHIELLTGDHPRAAAELAGALGLPYRAGLLPEDKIAIVRDYQERGYVVVMIGDGVNDAPALAQADVGIAMGAAGSDIAIEAAHIALMREDWLLAPEVIATARRTMRAVRLNLAFTAVYNLLGLSLAALGLLPPALAAAAQSLPDLGILANSARLLRR